MSFVSIALRKGKQMGKIMYNGALFILHKKVKTSYFQEVTEKIFYSYSKENHFMV